jgi:hypothetical protein
MRPKVTKIWIKLSATARIWNQWRSAVLWQNISEGISHGA